MGRSVSRLFIGIAVTFLATAATARAGDIAEQARPSNTVTIRGCLSGNVLTTLRSPRSDDPPERYELAGAPRFLELLKEHAGHTEEATGVLKTSSAGGAASSAAKPVDQGGGNKPAPSRPAPKVIDVTSMTHLSEKCS